MSFRVVIKSFFGLVLKRRRFFFSSWFSLSRKLGMVLKVKMMLGDVIRVHVLLLYECIVLEC